MDIAAILSGIKGKVLDAKHIELLKHAYDLQNQNIEQLKSNNEALREKAQLLEERAALLKNENDALRATVEGLQARVDVPPRAPSLHGLSDVALNIVKLYRAMNKTDLFMDEIAPQVRCSQIQLEAAIGELEDAGIIESLGGVMGRGSSYSLTKEAKRLLAKMPS